MKKKNLKLTREILTEKINYKKLAEDMFLYYISEYIGEKLDTSYYDIKFWKNKTHFMRYVFESKHLWIDKAIVWSDFKSKFTVDNDLIIYWCKKHLNVDVVQIDGMTCVGSF